MGVELTWKQAGVTAAVIFVVIAIIYYYVCDLQDQIENLKVGLIIKPEKQKMSNEEEPKKKTKKEYKEPKFEPL